MNIADADLASDLLRLFAGETLTDAHRPIRLRLAGQHGLLEKVLLVQRLDIVEGVCEGLTGHLTCLSTRIDLPLEAFIGLPVEVQLVTDRGGLRRICMIVTEARAGQSDGGLATFQLTARDAFALLERRVNTRIFLDRSVLDIARTVLDEHRRRLPALARCFDYDFLHLEESAYPRRACTFQLDENDADFLARLLRQAGLSWCFRAIAPEDEGAAPRHRLVVFAEGLPLPENAAGSVRYQRSDGVGQRDGIDLWAPVRRLVSGGVVRTTWDYKAATAHRSELHLSTDQGECGNDLASGLLDTRIEMPHAGDSWADHDRLTGLRLARHEFDAMCVHGSGAVRELAAGEWNRVDGHPELDRHLPDEREFLFTHVHHVAQNNLPKKLNERAQALMRASDGVPGWRSADGDVDPAGPRYRNRFVAVPRGTPIVPAWNPAVDLPATPLLTAVVVGPPGEEVWCDELGRVKVRFLGLDPGDHAHAQGAGTNGNDGDSAWLRVDFGWAGADFGVLQPLRVGMEVDVGFVAGDPSRPVVTGARYNGANRPPRFGHAGALPGNRYLSGVKTKEVGGRRYNQLRLDDTPGQISSQLASEHAHSELNLGFLTHARVDGRGTPRGEGAELRTDAPLALRGAQGVLISSAARPGASGSHLERAELVGLARSLQGIVEQLGTLADGHDAHGADPAKFRALVTHLQDWENGSNMAPGKPPGAAPIVAVSAAAGAAVVSQDNLVLGAQTELDATSAGNIQLSAGQRLLMQCGDIFSAFARGAMKLVSKSRIDLQADSIHLTARNIVLTATDEILLQSPTVRQVAAGAQVTVGGGRIVQQSSGPHVIKSASLSQSGGGGGRPAGASLPAGDLGFDQHVVIAEMTTDLPVAHQKIRIRVEDGQVIDTVTDADGKAPVFKSSIAFARYTVELLD